MASTRLTIAALARVIEHYAAGREDAARAALREVANAELRPRQATIPGVSPAEAGPRRKSREVDPEVPARLFEKWRNACDHPRAMFTPERKRAIVSRLREGYTEADISRAIEGAAAAAFTSDDGRRFDDLTLICRNGSKLESFIARAGADVVTDASVVGEAPVEAQIREVRRAMAAARAADNDERYDALSEKLRALMGQR